MFLQSVKILHNIEVNGNVIYPFYALAEFFVPRLESKIWVPYAFCPPNDNNQCHNRYSSCWANRWMSNFLLGLLLPHLTLKVLRDMLSLFCKCGNLGSVKWCRLLEIIGGGLWNVCVRSLWEWLPKCLPFKILICC